MSTPKRIQGESLHLDLPNGVSAQLPPIAALFLVLFDVKAGYTIAWKQSLPGLELSGSVEYKSMPSGLHNVHEDLIYFIHENDYVGISAFVNEPAAESERSALMLAVGALVPLSHGRLGKSWKHAEGLKDLARKLAQDSHNTQVLEDFWTSHQDQDRENSPRSGLQNGSSSAKSADGKQSQPSSHSQSRARNRAVSTASAFAPGQSLSSHHPALSLPALLDTFGPLVFPLYKAALLRKRILLVGQAPVKLYCDFVYDISVLSNIPSSVSDLLPLEPLPIRLRPLFSVGVHDIQTLSEGSRKADKSIGDAEEDGMGYGWVGCTTDDILATKENLYEALVTIPPSYTKQAKEKVWPRLEMKRGTDVKATQRDLRRYRTLRRELRRKQSGGQGRPPFKPSKPDACNEEDPNSNLPIENTQETFDDASSTSDGKLVESQSWSALAYSSFIWWASAGEKRTDLEEEAEYDNTLLRDLDRFRDASPDRPRSARSPMMSREIGDSDTGFEMTVIAYFHRLTALILGTIAEIVDASDGADEDQQADRPDRDGRNDVVFIANEDMARMGLDIWSEGDRRFVKELVELYWGRQADVQGARVECCGVRIC